MAPKSLKNKKKAKKKKPSSPIAKWIWPAVLVVTFVSFSPSLHNEFVNWDDDRNLYENDLVLNLNWENTKALFSTTVIGNYNPLSNLALGIQHQLFEGSDNYHRAFHVTNILLHLLCVFLVFQLGKTLKMSVFATTTLALLFALHPMRVESVAWVTEIKDVLYGAFFLGGLLLYAKRRASGKRGFSPAVFLLFLIGLFAKIQMVSFPLALMCIDYLMGEKSFIKSGLKHWPYFVGSLIFGAYGIYALGSDGSLETNNTFNLFERFFIGAYSWCVYIVKSIIPYRLSPLYPYPAQLSIWHYLSALPFLASFGLIFWFYKQKKAILFFGSAFFLVNIIFLLQILGAGQGYLADRFTYIPYFGLFFIYAHYLDKARTHPKYGKGVIPILAIALLGYAGLTYAQNKVWKNSETLWTHVLKYYDNSTLPYGNRANYYRDNGQRQKALEDYSASIRLKPNNAAPYNSRAKLYFAMNQDALALQDYIKALELEPDNAEYLVNRGAAYAKMGDYQNALADLNKGLELDPNNENGYLNRSLVWQFQGRYDLTLKDIQSYLRINPTAADIWYEAGRVQRVLGNNQGSLEAFSNAIKYNDRNGLYYLERGKVLFILGRFDESRNDAMTARQLGTTLDPEFVSALKGKGLM
jgi:tetratricopeptide (TPR) repeat protein